MKQLKCPSCGATLNQSFPNQLIVECPYCHQQVVNETFQSSGNDNEPHILEYSMNEEAVVNTMVNMLVEDQSVPTDIFDKMIITSITKYYVPMYIFEGTFRAPWTAKVERQEKRQRIGSDGKIENYYETLYDYPSGEAAGNFSINSIPSKTIADLGLDTNQIQMVSINSASLPMISSINMEDKKTKIIQPSGNSESIWWESGEPMALSVGRDAAYHQSPGWVTSCSASCELKKTSFVYIPLWIVDYSYMGQTFVFHSYAEQKNTVSHPNAEKIQAQPTEEQQFVLDKNKKRENLFSNIRNIGCLGIIVIGLIVTCRIDEQYKKNHYTGDDGSGFLWGMIILGIALFIVTRIARNYYRRKDGIDNIEEDVAKRNNILQNEADNYRKKTGEAFLKHFSGCYRESSAEQEMGNFSSDAGNKETYENLNISHLYTASSKSKKFCSNCGKEINGTHKFCRYCGAKL